jgi:hypothetical protein
LKVIKDLISGLITKLQEQVSLTTGHKSEFACLGVVEFYTGNAHEKNLIFHRPEQTSLSALQQASAGLKYAASAKISAGCLIPVQEGNLLGCRSTEIR